MRCASAYVVLVALTAVGASSLAATAAPRRDPSPKDVQTVFTRLGITPRPGDKSFRIPSSSMEPTLHCARPLAGCEAPESDRIIARPYGSASSVRRRDIVAFLTPPAALARCGASGTFVKRIVGLPGETIKIRLNDGDGYVYINGKPLKEPYIQRSRRAAVEGFGPRKIPRGQYLVMGDNRSQSCDSRIFGPVPAGNLVGRALAIYWPESRARRL